jgi:hypothetical protein
MSKGNRSTSDVIQLVRTARIITIYISIDRGRIDKRVRELTRVLGTPTGKLTNADTNGYGLAIECDFKLRRTRPSKDTSKKGREDDSGYLQHIVSSIHFSKKGEIFNIVMPHPPIELWADYEDVRNAKLTEVREKALSQYAGNEQTEEKEVIKVTEKKEKPKKDESNKDESKKENYDVSLLYI